MKYMLLIYGAESCWTEPEREACMQESMKICNELEEQGTFVAASPLHSVQTATSVRVRDGKRLITDGPFAETTEQLGGYYIIDVDNLDDAVAIATRLPPAQKGTVEIRPVFDVSGLIDRNECDIITKRDLPFSCEQIFAAFADPERLARWWGPKGFTNTFEEFSFTPGGHWRFVMHGPDGKTYDNHIVFEAIIPPEQIVFEHVSAPHFRTTFTLTPVARSATYVHWHMRFDSPKVRQQLESICVPANEENLDRLTAEIIRLQTN